MRAEALAAALSILLFSAGDTLAATWGKTGRWWWAVAMLAAGNAAWLLFAYLNRTMPLAAVSGIVNVGLTLVSVTAGFLVFKETLSGLEKIALAFGLLSLALFAAARLGAAR